MQQHYRQSTEFLLTIVDRSGPESVVARSAIAFNPRRTIPQKLD
ncbi:hypothetical protein QUB60_10980 [Microcoleus sp. A2-C5]|nr:hypothetical protein [Lyngbya sp. CCAP 1446/10]